MWLGMSIFRTVRGLGFGLVLVVMGISVTTIFAEEGDRTTVFLGVAAAVYGFILVGVWWFAYQNVKRLQQVVEELDETIRRNPRDAQTYAARAETYTLLSRAAQAGQDADKAIELGYDEDTLNDRLNELRRRRPR